MRWVRAAAVAGTVLLAGCSATADVASDTGSPRPVVPSSPTPSPSPSPAAPSPGPGIPLCGPDVTQGIGRTVAAQLDAFAAGDFRSAFALASESFRGSIDLKGFREVILSGYPEVAAAVDHRLVECRQPSPARASALVAVTGANGVTAQLAYRFVLESGEWRVDGASTLATRAVQNA